MAGLAIHLPTEQIAEICRRFGVSELMLFGSAARGEPSPRDLDFLVRFAPGTRPGLLHLGGLQQELEDLLGMPIDLVPRAGLKAAITDDVLRDATVVYAL
jgi:predicted nucleotidyltransferase